MWDDLLSWYGSLRKQIYVVGTTFVRKVTEYKNKEKV